MTVDRRFVKNYDQNAGGSIDMPKIRQDQLNWIKNVNELTINSREVF
jgi:hypothetical protein